MLNTKKNNGAIQFGKFTRYGKNSPKSAYCWFLDFRDPAAFFRFNTLPDILFSFLLFFLVNLTILSMSNMVSASEKENIDAISNNECEKAITTQEGGVSGYLEYKDEIGVCVYKGIPYAKPPLGDLRWQAPQPAESRDTLLQALTYGDDCMQSRRFRDSQIKSGTDKISENCLYLNIWRPAKPGKYPVMVWLHGGALLIGSGAWPIYEGTSFASRQDVIIVTINYRLGAFGYLSHPDLVNNNDSMKGGSAGNYGLLDQLEALQWVKENISSFSGDPNNITLFGESAGGWSVFTLLTVPKSRGLFHKAISQSGGSDATINSKNAYEIGTQFAENVKCSQGDNATCLRKIPAEKILETASNMSLKSYITGKFDTHFSFLPREDGTLIPKEPFRSIQSDAYLKIPVIVGYNSKDPKFLKNSTISSIENMSGHPSYLYKFLYKKNPFDILISGSHGVEIPFVFDTLNEFIIFYEKLTVYSESDTIEAQPVVDQIQSYWGNYAKTGNPNGFDLNGYPLPQWPLFSEKSGGNYLYLNNKIRSEQF